MENRFISFSPPDISKLEISEVCDAMQSGWITTGPRTKMLENRLAAYIETGRTDIDCSTKDTTKHFNHKVVYLNSATAAEELNLCMLGVGPGDEVIVPAYTYTATASAAIHCGAKVIFVDSQRDGNPLTHSPEMDYDAMESVMTERTKAVIPVDLAGIPCDYERIFEVLFKMKRLFRPNGELQERLGRVAVVSDCAHSLGTVKNGKMAGTLADFSSFSFHAVNVLERVRYPAACNKVPKIAA